MVQRIVAHSSVCFDAPPLVIDNPPTRLFFEWELIHDRHSFRAHLQRHIPPQRAEKAYTFGTPTVSSIWIYHLAQSSALLVMAIQMYVRRSASRQASWSSFTPRSS